MNDLNKMRIGVLRELKYVRRFLDNLEKSVKSRNPLAIQRAYMFLIALVYHMDKGSLTPDSIAYNLELARALEDLDNVSPPIP